MDAELVERKRKVDSLRQKNKEQEVKLRQLNEELSIAKSNPAL